MPCIGVDTVISPGATPIPPAWHCDTVASSIKPSENQHKPTGINPTIETHCLQEQQPVHHPSLSHPPQQCASHTAPSKPHTQKKKPAADSFHHHYPYYRDSSQSQSSSTLSPTKTANFPANYPPLASDSHQPRRPSEPRTQHQYQHCILSTDCSPYTPAHTELQTDCLDLGPEDSDSTGPSAAQPRAAAAQ